MFKRNDTKSHLKKVTIMKSSKGNINFPSWWKQVSLLNNMSESVCIDYLTHGCYFSRSAGLELWDNIELDHSAGQLVTHPVSYFVNLPLNRSTSTKPVSQLCGQLVIWPQSQSVAEPVSQESSQLVKPSSRSLVTGDVPKIRQKLLYDNWCIIWLEMNH